MIKECKIHGLTDHSERKSKGGYRCKKCMVIAVSKRRRKIKEMAVEYKGGKCEICGYNNFIGALEFHHIDPSKKDFNLGAKGHSIAWEKVKREIDKCVLLCSNCHKEEHNKMVVSLTG